MRKSSTPPAPATAPSKRDLLLDKAWELFCRDGYRAVGIDTLLAEAGVAKMTLYNHFESKEDLIAAAMERKGPEYARSLEATIAEAGDDPRRRLLAVFDWLEAWFSGPGFSGCGYLKAIGEYRGPDDKPRRGAIAFKEALRARIETLCREADVARPAVVARQFMMLVDGATLHADMHGQPGFAREAKIAAEAILGAAGATADRRLIAPRRRPSAGGR